MTLLSIRYFICPTCIEEIHDQLGHLEVMLALKPVVVNKVLRIKNSHGQSDFVYVLFVLRTVMVNKVLFMSYLY